MFKTLIIAHRLLWLAADTLSLKIRFVAGYIFGIFQGIITFASPLALSAMIKCISNNDTKGALFYFYALVVIAACLILSRYIWRYFIEFISTVLPLNLKEIYYAKIFSKPYNWHLHNSVGYFSSALNKVCDVLKNWLWKMPYDYVGSGVLALCFFGYTAAISYKLFLYFFISLVIMGIIVRVLYSKRLKYLDECARSNIAFDRSYIDFLYNVRSVKKMNLLEFVNSILGKKSKIACKKARSMMQYNALQYGFVELYINTLFLLPIGYFVYRFIQTGSGIDIIVMIAAIQPKIGELGRQFMSLMIEIARTKTEYGILAEHLGNVFAKNTEEKNIKNWKKIIFDKTKFEFIKDGSIFSHQVEYLEINKGDHMAVTGKSGEGKSTFLNLLTNQFSVEEGSISVDQTDYKNISENFFNSQMTYISQDVELFDMTFFDNIIMGKKIKKEKLDKVLKGCCLTELIERMNGNLHTDIGEKGIKVSGGERQRINLARGLLLDRNILVLDEITANLDPQTTEQIWKFIFEEYGSKTIIAVSHEKELLNHINRRIEFKKGKCREIT